MDPHIIALKRDTPTWNKLSKLRQQELINLKRIQINMQENYSTDVCKLPFNIIDIINIGTHNFPSTEFPLMVDPDEIILMIDAFCKNLVANVYAGDDGEDGGEGLSINNEIYDRRFTTTKTIIYSYLAYRKIIDARLSINCVNYILTTILNKIRKSIVEGGEHVGVSAATSIAEKLTQATLDTFHFAGVASKAKATQHTNVLRKILGATSSAGSTNTIYFTHSQTNLSHIKSIIKYLDMIVIRDIAISIQFLNDPHFTLGRTNIEFDKKYSKYWLSHNESVSLSERCLRLKLNLKKLYFKKISIVNITHALQLKFPKLIIVPLHKNIIRLFLDSGTMMNELKIFDELINEIPNVKVMGISGIAGYNFDQKLSHIKYYSPTRDLKTKDEYIITTMGVNLLEIFKISGIDIHRSTTNDIKESFRLFGIEAARNTIFNNIRNFYVDNAVRNINYHQIGLLADFMTCKGFVMPLTAKGLKKMVDVEPFQRITYEELESTLVGSAVRGDLDTMKSVSGNLIMGQAGEYGTNMVNIVN